MQTSEPTKVGYMNNSKLSFRFHSQTTYEQLLQRYDPDLLNLIKVHNQFFLQQPVYIIEAMMVPENLNWM